MTARTAPHRHLDRRELRHDGVVVAEKALPFDPLTPNAETIEAMKEARAGKLPRAKTVKGLLDALNADD